MQFLGLSVSQHIQFYSYTYRHGLINYIDTKAKCRHLKILKGFCCRCLSEFIDWRYRQSCWYFRPSYVKSCLSNNLLSGSTLPPSPLPLCCIHVYSVCIRGGFEVLGLRQIHTFRKVPLKLYFFRWRHFALPSLSLILLRIQVSYHLAAATPYIQGNDITTYTFKWVNSLHRERKHKEDNPGTNFFNRVSFVSCLL
jgi:hypothetical protein